MGEDAKKDKVEQIKMQTAEIEKSIKNSVKELEEIQKSCSHPKEHNKIKDINPEGSADLRKVCGLCNHILGYPTMEEMEEWTGENKDHKKKG